ncbi:MAG: hypothetical protein ACI9G1_000586 [Pirellulaceae bacterium]|jgi:hypothetical protein
MTQRHTITDIRRRKVGIAAAVGSGTSDHGLAMGSHGLRGKQNMYEQTVNAPMIFRGPKVPTNKKFDAQMYLRDMYV